MCSMNYLLSQEIDRIIGFAVSNGKKRIAFIIPDGDYEKIMSDAIKKATSKLLSGNSLRMSLSSPKRSTDK